MLRKQVKALTKAFLVDGENQAQRVSDTSPEGYEADVEGTWARVAASSLFHGTEKIWDAKKVKYAWHHGLSGVYSTRAIL
jgi:hypothetical protein